MNQIGYKLIPLSQEDRFRILIKADANDGDYSTEISELTVNEFEKVGLNQLRILKQFYSGSHQFESFYSEMIDVPYGDDCSCHSLEELEISFINKYGQMSKVELEPFTQEELKELNDKFGDDYGAYLQDLHDSYYE